MVQPEHLPPDCCRWTIRRTADGAAMDFSRRSRRRRSRSGRARGVWAAGEEGGSDYQGGATPNPTRRFQALDAPCPQRLASAPDGNDCWYRDRRAASANDQQLRHDWRVHRAELAELPSRHLLCLARAHYTGCHVRCCVAPRVSRAASPHSHCLRREKSSTTESSLLNRSKY